MGWSETYYRDYQEQARLAWERRAQQLPDELDLFALQVKEDADLLGLEPATYQELLERLRVRIREDFPAPLP
jgi:hypothetical protein